MTLQELMLLVGDERDYKYLGAPSQQNSPGTYSRIPSSRKSNPLQRGLNNFPSVSLEELITPNAFDVESIYGIAPQASEEKSPVATKGKSKSKGKPKRKSRDAFLQKVGKPVQSVDEYSDVLKHFDEFSPVNAGEPVISEMSNTDIQGPLGDIPTIDDSQNYTAEQQNNPSRYGTRPPPPLLPYVTDEQAREEAKRRIDEIYGPNLSNEALIKIPSHRRWEDVLNTAVQMALAYSAGENPGAAGASNVIQQFTRPQRYQQMIQQGTDVERKRLEDKRKSEQEESLNAWARDYEYDVTEDKRGLEREKFELDKRETEEKIQTEDAQQDYIKSQAEYMRERGGIERERINTTRANAVLRDQRQARAQLIQMQRIATQQKNRMLSADIALEMQSLESDIEQLERLSKEPGDQSVPMRAIEQRVAATRGKIKSLAKQHGVSIPSPRRGNVTIDKNRVINDAVQRAIRDNGIDQKTANELARRVRAGEIEPEEFFKQLGF